jgi:hypothetical protein
MVYRSLETRRMKVWGKKPIFLSRGHCICGMGEGSHPLVFCPVPLILDAIPPWDYLEWVWDEDYFDCN